MGKTDLKWRNVINNVFGPRPLSRTEALLPTTPRKSTRSRLQHSKSFLAESFRRLKSGTPARSTIFDEDVSFSSPMPPELRSISSGSEFSFVSWDALSEGDPFGQSFIGFGGVSDSYTKPFIPLRSQTLSTRYHAPNPVSSLPSFSKDHSHESISDSDSHKKLILNHNPTPLPDSIHHGPVQHSTTSISSNSPSQTHQLAHCSGAIKNPGLVRNSSFSSLASLVSYQSSPSSSLARSRSCNPSSGPQALRPKTPLSRHLSTSISLHNLKSRSTKKQNTKPLPSYSPSSFIDHQPGLEHRAVRVSAHSRSGSHVPIGTPKF